MKKQFSFLAIAAASILISAATINSAKAQQTTPPPPPSAGMGTETSSPVNFNVGVQLGIPTGVATGSTFMVVGGTGQFQFNLSPNFGLTATSGFYDFLAKEVPGKTYRYNGFQMIPLEGGGKIFLSPQFYFGAQAGAGFVTNVDGHTKLLLEPALGWANKHWDVNVKYESITGQDYNYGFVGLGITYNLPL